MSNYYPYNSPPRAGLQNVGSYQVSGIPYVTGGIDARATDGHGFTFPHVTRWITVANLDQSNSCRVAFSQNGIMGTNYYSLSSSSTITFEAKVTEIYLSGSSNCSIMAGLTTIAPERINNSAVSPSGSNWSGSAGSLVG